jgi:membrane peptidoglycan carboxypeptidase
MSTWRPITEVQFWKRWLPAWMHAPVILLFWGSMGSVFVGLCLVFFYYLKASDYDIDEVGKIPRENVYYDRSGKIIDLSGTGGVKIIGRADISDDLVQA